MSLCKSNGRPSLGSVVEYRTSIGEQMMMGVQGAILGEVGKASGMRKGHLSKVRK